MELADSRRTRSWSLVTKSTKRSTYGSESASSAGVTINSTMAGRLFWITWLVLRGFCRRFELRGFGRLVEPEVLAPTACGGKRLVGTRTSVSSILGSEESNGGATLRRHPLQQVSLTPHQTYPRQRAQGKARRQEKGWKELVLHVLAPLRRWHRRRDPVPPLRSCVCRSDRQLPFVKLTPSRRSC